MFEELAFRLPFRKYQRMILDQVVFQQKDDKYHLVAPPGSGKTIIGLELIRKFDSPAVVFAPTTTIQSQWKDKVGLFVVDSGSVDQFASMDPLRSAPIQILTYQIISTPAEAQQHLREAGLLLWQEELVRDGQATDAAVATIRQEAIRQNNPEMYHKELLRYANRVKHQLLHEPGANIEPYLHPNARKLIESLVANGVRTVVLMSAITCSIIGRSFCAISSAASTDPK
jgi:hypothetical protein